MNDLDDNDKTYQMATEIPGTINLNENDHDNKACNEALNMWLPYSSYGLFCPLFNNTLIIRILLCR